MKLVGEVAVVTGGSRGIGLGAADFLMAHGADVAICAPDFDEVKQAATVLERSHPGRHALAVAADVTRSDDVERLLDEAEAQLGPVAIMVNNAGGGGLDLITDLSEDDWNAVIALNLTGTFLGTRAALRRMKASQTAGVIINVGSVQAYATTRGNAHYTAAKAGIAKLTEVAALEAGEHGIRVNSVSPGITVTPLMKAASNPRFEAAWRRSLALDRFGEPADVAKAIVFLASDYASWITGINILVDGGTHLRGLPDYVDHSSKYARDRRPEPDGGA